MSEAAMLFAPAPVIRRLSSVASHIITAVMLMLMRLVRLGLFSAALDHITLPVDGVLLLALFKVLMVALI